MDADAVICAFLRMILLLLTFNFSNGAEQNLDVTSLLTSTSSPNSLSQLQTLALDELAILAQKQNQQKQKQLQPQQQQHQQQQPSSSSTASEEEVSGAQFNLFDFPSEDSSIVKRKMNILSEVHDAVVELFEQAIGRRRDGLVGEAFGQLRMRCIEKIFNLKFLLQVVDRLVSERTHLERMSNVFETLAKKRTNETEFLVTQVHRTAAELSESIRSDLARVVDQVDGGILSHIFSSPLIGGSGSGLLGGSSPLLSIIGKMDAFRRFAIKKTARGEFTIDE